MKQGALLRDLELVLDGLAGLVGLALLVVLGLSPCPLSLRERNNINMFCTIKSTWAKTQSSFSKLKGGEIHFKTFY